MRAASFVLPVFLTLSGLNHSRSTRGGEVDGSSIRVIICERMGLVTRGQMLLLSGIKSPGDGVMGGGKGKRRRRKWGRRKEEDIYCKAVWCKGGTKGHIFSLSPFFLFFLISFFLVYYYMQYEIKLYNRSLWNSCFHTLNHFSCHVQVGFLLKRALMLHYATKI